ncbi:FadR/GntR family transcriptional regulator [Streptomyces sp. NPDC020379]|uniref:FadR/GntR family transcriptional regulator n=1 Tax=Streptomyces sp. NPDC020379 TaxID=3365071 RepID=UPI003794CDF7
MDTADPRDVCRRTSRYAGEPPALRRDDWERSSTRSRAEVAADRVAERVARTKPGARLGTKDELRAECGVSVGTFNESLRLLQARGLVTVRPGPGGGLFAARQQSTGRLSAWAESLDDGDPADARRIRDALDPLLVEDALWHASPADLAVLRIDLAALAQAAGAADAPAFARADRQLRGRLASFSPTALLRSLYDGLLPAAEQAELAVDAEGLRARYERQAALVEALDIRDKERAVRLAATPVCD